MRPIQYFSDEYLERCKGITTEQVLEFLETFRKMQEKPKKSKLISLKVPEPMLESFKQKSALEGIKYQTKIKSLMQDWLTQ
ncbi:CopG family antitoxin [Ghiorsea bivora]|uniref:CopG family antitoxin n=1 Tax=Ghiorsea bivora TaxID=1485545 RepID=UPI00057171E5|nr:hypothetical protein [Ghiorsea bivora]